MSFIRNKNCTNCTYDDIRRQRKGKFTNTKMSSRDALLKLVLLDLLFEDDDILIALTLSSLNSQFMSLICNYLMDRDSESEESVTESESEESEDEAEEDDDDDDQVPVEHTMEHQVVNSSHTRVQTNLNRNHLPEDVEAHLASMQPQTELADPPLAQVTVEVKTEVDDEETSRQDTRRGERNSAAKRCIGNVTQSRSGCGLIKPHDIKSEPADDHDMTYSRDQWMSSVTEIKREPEDELMEMDCFNMDGVKVEVETEEDCDWIDLPCDRNVSAMADVGRVKSNSLTNFDLSDACVKMQHESDCESTEANPVMTSRVDSVAEAGCNITDLYKHDQPTSGFEVEVKTEPNTEDTYPSESHSFDSWLQYSETPKSLMLSGAPSALTTLKTASNGGNNRSSVSDQHPLLTVILHDHIY